MKTIKSILQEIKENVEQERVVSPNQWINYALELTSLWSDLKNELLKAEIIYSCELAKLMEKEMSKAKAEITVKALPAEEGKMGVYELWRYLVGRDKLVEEFVKLCKVRAKLENEF